jgi:hypothetical protein
MTTRSLVLTAALFLTIGASCDVTTPALDDVGTVRFIALEGGCWVIETADEVYEPINLPEEFWTDGLGVSFEAVERTDMASICMVGTIVELLRIQPNEG